jgi:hypothetical protein
MKRMTVEVIDRFNRSMERLGLGARVELKGDRVSLREIWPGAGQAALAILTTTPELQRGPDGWLVVFLEDLVALLLADIKAERKHA